MLPFKDQKSANNSLLTTWRPWSEIKSTTASSRSKNIADHLREMKETPLLINQQSVVGLCVLKPPAVECRSILLIDNLD